MSSGRHTIPTALQLAARYPISAICVAALTLAAGFTLAWLSDTYPQIRAEGGSEPQEGTVWPQLDHSFPQEVAFLSPEPLMVPVPRLGPARVEPAVLAAAMNAMLAKNDTTGTGRSPVEVQPKTDLLSNPDVSCLPAVLVSVLAELEAKFGPGVSVVSTSQLRTGNHARGSIREKLHLDGKAVDIRVPKDPTEVVRFLRQHPEIGGAEMYRNKVIHFDLREKPAVTRNSADDAPRPTAPPSASENLRLFD